MQQQLIPLCVGERLREAREKRKLTLSDIARKLRIDEPVIEALEAGELDHLAPVYQRGYVTAYARFLDFEPSEIEQMLNSIGNVHPLLHTVFPEAGNPNQADRWLKATSYVLASLLIGTLAWQFTHEAVRLSQDGKNLVSGLDNPEQSPPGQTLNPSTRQSDGTQHVSASIAALDVLDQQRIVRNSGGQQAWAALRGSGQDTQSELAMPEGEFVLELTASGDSWVEITDANGQQLELDLVRGGSNKRYQGAAPFRIQFGRASAVSLYLDGQPVDLAPFTRDEVTQMWLDGSNIGTRPAKAEPGNG
jgi:cytoskeleton protein RodZ